MHLPCYLSTHQGGGLRRETTSFGVYSNLTAHTRRESTRIDENRRAEPLTVVTSGLQLKVNHTYFILSLLKMHSFVGAGKGSVPPTVTPTPRQDNDSKDTTHIRSLSSSVNA